MSYNERLSHILAAFRIAPTAKLPVNGASPRFVNVPLRRDGFVHAVVWINPLPEQLPMNGRMWKRSTHRVMCQCPVCGRTLSAGRLHQHINTAACVRRAARDVKPVY